LDRQTPPYHGGFELWLRGAGTALATALSLHFGEFVRQTHLLCEIGGATACIRDAPGVQLDPATQKWISGPGDRPIWCRELT
jgi:hypothetical protein